jgi:hypothetical protein
MNIGTLIPQVFYDLIGRIVPGLIILVIGYFAWKGHNINDQDINNLLNWFEDKDKSTFLHMLSFILISYTVAFILDGFYKIYEMIKRLINGKNKNDLLDIEYVKNSVAKTVCADFIRSKGFFYINIMSGYNFPSVPILYDLMRLKDKEVGARLVKLSAEIKMCQTIKTGLIIVIILCLIKIINNIQLLKYYMVFSLIILLFIISFVAIDRHLKERFQWSLCNHWLLLFKSELIKDNSKN